MHSLFSFSFALDKLSTVPLLKRGIWAKDLAIDTWKPQKQGKQKKEETQYLFQQSSPFTVLQETCVNPAWVDAPRGECWTPIAPEQAADGQQQCCFISGCRRNGRFLAYWSWPLSSVLSAVTSQCPWAGWICSCWWPLYSSLSWSLCWSLAFRALRNCRLKSHFSAFIRSFAEVQKLLEACYSPPFTGCELCRCLHF